MPVIGQLLQELVNESLKEGTVPDIIKMSTVRPEPKTTRPKLAEEYRPINMLSTLDRERSIG